MADNAKYLAVVRDGQYVITTFSIEDKGAEAHIQKAFDGWRKIYPNDHLAIRRLSMRNENGFEFATEKGA
jgi:hypothetical protein